MLREAERGSLRKATAKQKSKRKAQQRQRGLCRTPDPVLGSHLKDAQPDV